MSEEKQEIFIGKITFKQIRKAYFDNKLEEILNKIQSEEEISEEKGQELYNFLEKISKEREGFLDKLLKTFDGTIIEEEKRPPSVEELQGETADLSEEWKEKQSKADAWINGNDEKIKRYLTDKEKNILPRSFWLDLAVGINVMTPILDKIRVYNDQQYRAKMTKLIDDFDISRKEAEERSKLTPQYADYKNSLLQKERLEELINICKKYDTHN